jgi:ERF superfamily protein
MNDTGAEGEDFKPGPLVYVPKPAPAETFAGVLMTMLADKDIPADKMEVVMRMRREVLGDQAREAFMEHFAAFSAELPQVERDGTVELVKDGRTLGKYSFTTIEGMDVILRPLLAKHGFAISFASSDAKDAVTITGTLSGWGWERSSTYTLPPDKGPGRNELQARGSSRRYAKRYVTDDLCNVVRKGKDDDARGAMEALIDATQIKELVDLIKATATDEAMFLKTMVSGAESLQEVRQRDFPRLLMALREKKQRRASK